MSPARGDLTVGYGERDVLRGLDCPLPAGQITAIVGANASGKSTLLRAFARLLKPTPAHVLLDGAEISSLPTREVARRLGFLPQSPVPPEGLTVEDLVQRGRFPHQRLGRRATVEDRERVEWALEATGTDDLRDRPLDRLSGGQRQRAWIAMALAQDTPILLLDEPTTYLDLAHQLEVLDLLADLNDAGPHDRHRPARPQPRLPLRAPPRRAARRGSRTRPGRRRRSSTRSWCRRCSASTRA